MQKLPFFHYFNYLKIHQSVQIEIFSFRLQLQIEMSTTLPKSPHLDMNDFNRIYKFKFVIPAIFLLNLIGVFFGPIFFGKIYAFITLLMVIVGVAKLISMFIAISVALVKNTILIEKVRGRKSNQKNYVPVATTGQQIYHAIIIPSYKESQELISQTLEVLASHDRAKSSYIIVLAMEKHEAGSDKKAQQIISKFCQKFRLMHFTVHQIRQFEQKGKASNVSWSVEHLESFFQQNMIDEDNVQLTIMDADSWLPNIYFQEVQAHLKKNYQRKNKTCFTVPQIYTRNQMDVPAISRVADITLSQMQCSNSFSFNKMSFPISNYSVSYSLMKSIGFWDTTQDAIGQDFHTFQKIFWKTDGDIDCVPIFAPTNQTNITTGNGYIEDVKARFWQGERHARGLADLAYNLHKMFNQKLNMRKVLLFLSVCDFTLFPVVMPFLAVTAIYQGFILSYLGVEFTPSFPEGLKQYIQQFCMCITLLSLLIYEIIKRRSTTYLYGLKNDSFIRSVFDVNVFSPLVILCFWTPACIIANFGNLKSGRQYRVAQKKSGDTPISA